MSRVNRRRPKDDWLLSEAAPFIRRILRKWATDADRTKVALELADWLEARGDRMGYVEWFRHPKLRWQRHNYGISWRVDPWDNKGHGSSARIDVFWWTANYPTPEYVASKAAEEITRAWIKNGVEFEEYPWTREVAARIGLLAEYDKQVKWRAASREQRRKQAIEDDIRDRKTYASLRLKLNAEKFRDGGGI